MDNIFRQGRSGRLESVDLVKRYYGGVSQDIANEFWTLTNYGTKQVSITIKNAVGSLVASTAVKYALFEYKSGNPYNFGFMSLVKAGIQTTSAGGVLTVIYTGEAGVGETVYVAVLHPNSVPTESMIWTTTVVYQ